MRKVFVIVNGMGRYPVLNSTCGPNWVTLVSHLPTGAADIFCYSYRCGSLQGSTWQSAEFEEADSYQELGVSVGRLRGLVQRLKSLGRSVRVAGFSLGGLVAVNEVAAAAAERDNASLPDALLAIDSPLEGRNMNAVQTICANAELAGGVAGLAAAIVGDFSDGAALGATALGAGWVSTFCPKGPVVDDLLGIYSNAGWRTSRSALLRASGVRIGTVINDHDCFYAAAICAHVIGSSDVDDRAVMAIDVASWSRHYSTDLMQHFWHILDNHHAIMNDVEAMIDAARFLAS